VGLLRVAYLLCMQGAKGSIPFTSTNTLRLE